MDHEKQLELPITRGCEKWMKGETGRRERRLCGQKYKAERKGAGDRKKVEIILKNHKDQSAFVVGMIVEGMTI